MVENEFEKWRKNAHYLRGEIINAYCVLEKNIEYEIADCYALEASARMNLMDVVLDRMTFEAKRQCLNSLLIQDSLKKGGGKRHQYSSLMSEIQKLIEIRNYFAHYHLNSTSGVEKNAIVLSKYRDEHILIKYSEEEIKTLHRRILKANQDVYSINKI